MSEDIWTDEQIAALNHWQARGDVHPFTCPGDHDRCHNQRELRATPEGWVCACGEYKQAWAHEFMLAAAKDARHD